MQEKLEKVYFSDWLNFFHLFIFSSLNTLFFQISAVELEETETLVWNGKIRIQTKNLLIQTENEK